MNNSQSDSKFLYRLIDVLMRTMERRESYTHNHQNWVAIIARRIAQELKMSAKEVEGIRVAGQLHDIGKIAIPTELLTKVGSLCREEFDLIKTHVVHSVEILESIEFPWPILQMINQHHERLDGSGYPQGLKDDDIVDGARILALADMANAVSGPRPYRPAQGIDGVLKILEEDQGCSYDREVAKAFYSLLKRDDEELLRALHHKAKA